MGVIGVIFLVVGGVIMLVGGIWILVLAFQHSVLWGLGCLFIPFVSLVFVIMYWAEAGKPFLISLGGGVLYFIGTLMAFGGA